MAMKLKNLLLDLGGVLVDADHSRAVAAFQRITGADAQRIRSVIYDSGLLDHFELGEIDASHFREAVCAALGTKIREDDFNRAWCSAIGELENVESLLEKLDREFVLIVLSNTNSIHFEAICEMFPSWIELISGFHLSFEIGLKKPSREYFEAALQRFSLDAENCVFLDDDLNNVRGAEGLGIRSHEVGDRGLNEDELKAWKLI